MKYFTIIISSLLVSSSYGASLIKRDLTQDLLTQAVDLENKVLAAITKLSDEGLSEQAAILQREVDKLQTVATELKVANAESTVSQLENLVRTIETKIQEGHSNVQGITGINLVANKAAKVPTAASFVNFVKRDLKSDLLTRAANLEASATAVIKKLIAEGRAAQAAALQREVQSLQILAAQLKAATVDATVRLLETQIGAIETRISEEIRRVLVVPITTVATIHVQTTLFSTTEIIHPTTSVRDLRDDLLIRISELQSLLKIHAKKLTDEGKVTLAIELLTEESKLEQLVFELKAATSDEDVLRLELEAVKANSRINNLLKNIDMPTTTIWSI